jgi:chromosome segregation ATPase
MPKRDELEEIFKDARRRIDAQPRWKITRETRSEIDRLSRTAERAPGREAAGEDGAPPQAEPAKGALSEQIRYWLVMAVHLRTQARADVGHFAEQAIDLETRLAAAEKERDELRAQLAEAGHAFDKAEILLTEKAGELGGVRAKLASTEEEVRRVTRERSDAYAQLEVRDRRIAGLEASAREDREKAAALADALLIRAADMLAEVQEEPDGYQEWCADFAVWRAPAPKAGE